MRIKAIVALTSLALISSNQALAHIASIDGQYEAPGTYDTPSLIFHNASSFSFTNAQMVLTGYQGINNGVTQTVALPDMAANSDTIITWNGPGPLFAYDYDDTQGGPGPCPANPVNTGLCARVGNFSVTFTAIWNGMSIFSQFSPHNNATGGFVGWEGLDPSGLSEDPNYDVHNGTLNGIMAYIDAGAPSSGFNPNGIPEPATLLLTGISLAGLLSARRRRV